MRLLSPRNRTAAGLAVALIVLGLINVLASRNAARLVAEADEVARTYTTIIGLRSLLAHIVDAETGQRGYVITGDERYLEPYLSGRQAISADLAALRSQLRDPSQQARLQAVEPIIAERLDQLERVVDIRRRVGFQVAAKLIGSDVGKVTQDRIRAMLAELEQAHLVLLDQRATVARASANNTSTLVFLGSALAFIAALAAVVTMHHYGLSAGEDRFRRALDNAPLPVFIHAEDSSVLFANRAFGETTGVDPAAFRSLGAWPGGFVGGEGLPERLAQLYAGDTGFDRVERQISLADGRQRTWLISSAALGPGPDRRRQAITMIVDLTERKQAEAALAAYAARLRDLSLRLVEVQESERRAIARELHDEVGQALTGLDLVIEMASRAPAGSAHDHLRTAQGYVRDLTARVRNLSLDLRPSMLDDLGLLPALRWLFERYTEQTRIAVDLRSHDADRRFPAAVETAAYRIIQEALTNVARHAGVATVTVQLWGEPSRLAVQIEDNGAGFDVAAARAARRSTGIEGMCERAELIGGSLTLESAPGQGTIVIVELPLDATSQEEIV